ncbi:hypothetical protein ABK040_012867 [Willaertia magna]
MLSINNEEGLNNKPSYVWYCSYGSNCNFERFKVYLEGGRPKNCGTEAPEVSGSRISKLPHKSFPILLKNCKLLFAKHSRTWNGGGVCFFYRNQQIEVPFNVCCNVNDFCKEINTHKDNLDNIVIGRIYKIEWSQFVDIVSQENGQRYCKEEHLNLIQEQLDNKFHQLHNELIDNELVLFNTWYGKLIRIGHYEDCPIYTFTTNENEIPNRVNEHYLTTIGKGILESFHSLKELENNNDDDACQQEESNNIFTVQHLVNYFLTKEGVKEHYDAKMLEELFQ